MPLRRIQQRTIGYIITIIAPLSILYWKNAQSILQLLVLTNLKANEVFQVCTFAILWNRRKTKSVLKSNLAGNKQR